MRYETKLFANNLMKGMVKAGYIRKPPEGNESEWKIEKIRKDLEQTRLANDVGISNHLVHDWLDGKGKVDPVIIPRLCETLQVSSDYLFGVSSIPNNIAAAKDYDGIISYVITSQPNLSEPALEYAKKGAELFEYIISEDIAYTDIPLERGPLAFRNRSLTVLGEMQRLAFTSGTIQITGVSQDEELQQDILAAYSGRLRDVIVAQVPRKKKPRTGYRQSSIIQTELVAFLAAKQFKPVRVIGLGWGYTILRFTHLLPSSPAACVSLCAMRDENIDRLGYSPNCAITNIQSKFPKVEGYRRPYLTPDERAELNNGTSEASHIKEAASNEPKTKNMDAVFLSVNGSTRALTGNRQMMRTADHMAEYSDAGRIVDGLTDDVRESVCEILGWLVDKNGKGVGLSSKAHYSISLENLQREARATPVWLLAARYYKATAAHTAIMNGYVNSLVIDAELAERLLEYKRQNA